MDVRSRKNSVDHVEQSEHEEARIAGAPCKPNAHASQLDLTMKDLQHDVQKETHANVDKSEREMIGDITAPLVKLTIPDAALDIPAEAMVKGLVEKGFYDVTHSCWAGWKDEMTEADLSDYFNKLADAVDQIIEERQLLNLDACRTSNEGTLNKPRRRWTHLPMDKDYPRVSCEHKPNLICIEDGAVGEWPAVQAYCNKMSTSDVPGAQRRGWEYSNIAFFSQHNRRFVLGCAVANDAIRLFRIDRSGMFTSGQFPLHECPEQFIRIVVGLTLLDSTHLGFDTTLSIKHGVGEVTLKDTVYKVLGNIHADIDVLGRGTMCFQVEHPADHTTCVLKDTWVDVEKTEKEGEILQKLNDLGVTNIPTYVDSEVVHVDGRVDSTKDIRAATDNAYSVAQRVTKPLPVKSTDKKDDTSTGQAGQDDSKKTKKKKKKKQPNLKNAARRKGANVSLPIRDHHRIIVAPYGTQFCKFRCLEEFLLAIKDIISGVFAVAIGPEGN